jgi:hypothetical protein
MEMIIYKWKNIDVLFEIQTCIKTWEHDVSAHWMVKITMTRKLRFYSYLKQKLVVNIDVLFQIQSLCIKTWELDVSAHWMVKITMTWKLRFYSYLKQKLVENIDVLFEI